MVDTLEKTKCTGCKACGSICPKNAITFKDDSEGFWYPIIDNSLCINCGLCEKACPAINKVVAAGLNRTSSPKTLEVKNTDTKIRIESTSGGVYYPIAEDFLADGGYIAGCVYDDDWNGAHHIVSNDVDGLNKIFRSKYFQSDTREIYREILGLLKAEKKVLFCGTPCQVAGLYTYLGKEYDGLYTLDFVCRGINSPKAFRAYMKELKTKYHSEIKNVHFKNKSHGWLNLGTRVEFDNGKVYYRNRHTDPWVNGFINGNLYMRPVCSHCEYKSFPRVADISFGDFWGLKFTKDDEYHGVSLVLINSEKGQRLFEKSRSSFYVNERRLEEATKGNPAILNRIPEGKHRQEFFANIDDVPFSKLVWRLIGWSTPKWQIRYALIVTKKWLSGLKKKD